jgi:hypothetical protein
LPLVSTTPAEITVVGQYLIINKTIITRSQETKLHTGCYSHWGPIWPLKGKKKLNFIFFSDFLSLCC